MKEFIEKLIGRLEEVGKLEISMHGGRCNGKTLALGYAKGIENSIAIVNQLAEEYNNDFCEWKFETTGIVWHCNGCETYNLPYAMNLRIIADDFECKCPHCGKKIKVVE